MVFMSHEKNNFVLIPFIVYIDYIAVNNFRKRIFFIAENVIKLTYFCNCCRNWFFLVKASGNKVLIITKILKLHSNHDVITCQ